MHYIAHFQKSHPLERNSTDISPVSPPFAHFASSRSQNVTHNVESQLILAFHKLKGAKSDPFSTQFSNSRHFSAIHKCTIYSLHYALIYASTYYSTSYFHLNSQDSPQTHAKSWPCWILILQKKSFSNKNAQK